jgi:hypothetical protein
MSRIKNMSRAGWFIIGVVIAVLLVPSVAVAAGLKFTGIEGTNGNKATVDGDGQLQTTPPVADDNGISTVGALGAYDLPLVAGTSTDDVVVTSVDVDVNQLGAGRSQIVLGVVSGSTCTFSEFQAVDSSSIGATEVTYPSGVVVGSGFTLCADQTVTNANAIVSAWGYTIPKGTENGVMENLKSLAITGPS